MHVVVAVAVDVVEVGHSGNADYESLALELVGSDSVVVVGSDGEEQEHCCSFPCQGTKQ